MLTNAEMMQERQHLVLSARDMIEKAKRDGRFPTPEEKAELGKWQERIKELDDLIAKAEEFERQEAEIEALVKTVNKPPKLFNSQDRKQTRPDDKDDSSVPRIEVLRRYSTLKAFKGDHADERAYRAGQWARAALFNDDRAKRYCMNNGIEVRAMGISNNANGGFLVPDEMSQAIIDLRETYGVFRQNTKVIPMGRDTLSVPRRSGGLTAYFVNENTEVTASDKTWDMVTLTAKKLAILSKMSSELAEDAIINLGDDIAAEAAYQFAYKEDLCGFNGDGTSTYGGIVGVTHKIDNVATASKVAAPSGHTALVDIDATDLANLMGKLPQYARPMAKWYCSQTAYDIVFSRLAAAAGGNTVQTLNGAFQPSYLGYPIVTSQVLFNTTTDSNGSIALLFGSLSQATTLGDRREFTMKVSDQRYMELDQIGILCTQRFDIVAHDVGDASTAGAMVALELTT